ncbi:DUF1269 domain-containing protein [Streptomyces beijiangensis]|uniref:DUF1269 domain-containing protein n=1 Tax=Streptomyces beijiangensis TaxID=163361 RepID=A0A939JJ23_9ACTN|nr:DUF1269 domain-containing protein [Streptomyces beijiangensis]MBO0513785.1 DUF1269 domain-containing protein [Streptomyces beijiangensis]
MSELIVIGYEDPAVANKAFRAVQQLKKDSVVDYSGLAVVSVDAQGETHVDTPRRDEKVPIAATAGALWGLVFGMVILVPVFGVVGAAVGGLAGKLSQMGLDAKFRARVDSLLQPGSAAVVVMAPTTGEAFSTEMAKFGGTVLKTTLPEDEEKELSEMLLAGTA